MKVGDDKSCSLCGFKLAEMRNGVYRSEIRLITRRFEVSEFELSKTQTNGALMGDSTLNQTNAVKGLLLEGLTRFGGRITS